MLEEAVVADTDVVDLVQQMLGDEEAGWNIGTFGAIAEFHHVVGDPPAKPVVAPDGGELVTERGGLRVGIRSDVQPVAYEGLTKRPDGWTLGIAFCLPAEDARMHGREVLTEIGVDHEALRDENRNDVLFDLGIGAPHVDFCIRVREPSLLNALRACTGRSILDATNPAMAAIKAAHPHRICLSRLGRVEVYQPIGSAATGMASPIGPHTHLLPGLLGTGRSHSANTPIPEGRMPVLSLHPANPVTDRVGNARPFDAMAFEAFQTLLDAFGPPGYVTEKRRLGKAVRAGLDPLDFVPAASRTNRRAARVGLRQMLHTESDLPHLGDWLDVFDRGAGGCDADAHDA